MINEVRNEGGKEGRREGGTKEKEPEVEIAYKTGVEGTGTKRLLSVN